MNRLVFRILLTFLFAFLWFCSSDKNPVDNNQKEIDYGSITTIKYTEHVQALFDKYCVSCHGAQKADAGLRLDSWDNLIKGSDFGEAVIPFDADNSLMIEMLTKLRVGGTLNAHPADQGEAALDTVKINFLARWINEGAKNDNAQVPYANSQHRLYVCSQGESIVNIIDADALVVIRNVDLTEFGLPRSAKPHHIAFDPSGQFWFVSCIDNQVNKVLKFTMDTNELVGEVSTSIPALLGYHPTDNELYISRFMDVQNPTTSIFAVNALTLQPIDNGNSGEILLPPGLQIPHAMGISHDGKYVYTCSFSEDQFLVIDHATEDFADAVPLGNDRTPMQLTVAPNDSTIYISCIGTGEMVEIDVSNPAHRFIADSIMIGGQPWHPTFTDDGTRVYVGNLANNNFSVINTADNSVQSFGAGDGSDGLSQPHGIEYYKSDTGVERVFISGRNVIANRVNGTGYLSRYDFGDNEKIGTVVVIDATTNTIEKVLEIENFGSGMRLWK